MNIADLIAGGIVISDDDYSSTTTWNKPTAVIGNEYVEVSLWGAGGGGGYSGTVSSYAGGGGAGQFLQVIVPIWMLPPSLAAEIGAPGAGGLRASSTPSTGGGNTKFGPFTAKGGARGNDQVSAGSGAATGPNAFAAGIADYAKYSLISSGAPGAAAGANGNDGYDHASATPLLFGPGSGAGGSTATNPTVPLTGGNGSPIGGSGNGGNGASSTIPAVAGQWPGGGGGGGRGNSDPYASGGAGGGGRIRIRVLRP